MSKCSPESNCGLYLCEKHAKEQEEWMKTEEFKALVKQKKPSEHS